MRRKANVDYQSALTANEQAVLAVLKATHAPMSVKAIAAVLTRPMDESTIYRIIERFTDAGMATTRWAVPDDDMHVKPFRVATLTAKGAAVPVAS